MQDNICLHCWHFVHLYERKPDGEVTSGRLMLMFWIWNLRYMKHWSAHLPRIWYIRVKSKDGESPAITWAEFDTLCKLCVCRQCNLLLKLLGQITEESYVTELPNWCQTVDLTSKDVLWIRRMWGLISVIWDFFYIFLVLESWYLKVIGVDVTFYLTD